MKSFSVKQYTVIPVRNGDELSEVLQKTPVINLPDSVPAEVVGSEGKACFFIVFETASNAYSGFASFVFDEGQKNVVDVKIISSINDIKLLEKIITKITDWMYNKIGGIYFRINKANVTEDIVSAAKKSGYKQKKGVEDLLELDKNVEIGIIGLIAGL